MAKKKRGSSNSVIDYSLFSSAQDILDEEKILTMLPVGPAIDTKTGGGILEGSFVLIRTRPKLGKTVLATQIAVNALNQGRYVVYVDAERRFSGQKYFQMKGLDLSNKKLTFLRSQMNEKTLTGNDIYKTIKDMMGIPKYNGTVYIIDSFSQILPKDTAESTEVTASRRDTTPKLNADFCKQAGNLARTTRSIIIGIQHLITDTGNYGGLVPSGGVKLEYESDYVFECKHKPLDWEGATIDSNKNTDIKGQLMKLQIPFNKMLAPHVFKDDPVMTYIKYGEGIWWARECLDFLVNELGVAYKNKSWYNIIMPDGTTEKAQGPEKAVELIEEHREVFEKMVRDYFIEKYKVNYNFVPTCDDDDDSEDE